MTREALRRLLEDVQAGRLDLDQALHRLRRLPYDDLRFAKIDLHRELRAGAPEAIFCQGKTPAQVVSILSRLVEVHDNVIATRVSEEVASAVVAAGIPHAPAWPLWGQSHSPRRSHATRTSALLSALWKLPNRN